MEKEEEEASSSSHRNFFHKWINLQQEDLSELLQSQQQTDITDPNLGDSLSRLVEKNIQHFKDYIDERSQFSQTRAVELFAPSWCSSHENSQLWIAGCRPSLFIRLIYGLTGFEIESQLTEFIQTGDINIKGTALLSGLSTSQLTLIDSLHRRTIKEEKELTSRMASLQEEIADQPLALSLKKQQATRLCELDVDTAKWLDEHEKSMAVMLEEADKLRMKILKEVIDVLTPLQAVDFLATGKKLHLCMHELGTKRDEMRK